MLPVGKGQEKVGSASELSGITYYTLMMYLMCEIA